MIKIFISYSSNDSSFADRLAEDLDRLDAKVFYDKWSIKVGDSIVEKISTGLSSHDVLLVILSKSSVESNWVKREINSTLMRQLSHNNIKVIPALIEECNLPILLSDIKYANFIKSYKSGFQEIVDSFEEELELDMFLEIVEKACSEIELREHQTELAILLKKIAPIPFFRNEILWHIYEASNISEKDLLSKIYNPEYSHPEVIQTAKEHLGYLSKEKLIVVTIDQEIAIESLGRNICRCLDFGFNEGLLSPACSS